MRKQQSDWTKALGLLMLLQVEAIVIVIAGVWVGNIVTDRFDFLSKDNLLLIKATILLLSLLIVFYVWIKTFLVIFKKK